MANITNFACAGVTLTQAQFTWTPPTADTPFTYQIVITGGSGLGTRTFTPAVTEGVQDQVPLNYMGTGNFLFNGTFARGTTYTASINYSSVVPPGTPSFASIAVTTTFSLGATTCGICPTIGGYLTNGLYPYATYLVDSGGQTGTLTATLVTTPASTQPVKTINFTSATQQEFVVFDAPLGFTSLVLTTSITGATNGTNTTYSLVKQPSTWPSSASVTAPVITGTSIQFYWLTPNSYPSSAPFIAYMLYNIDTDAYVTIKSVAYSAGNATISGLVANTKYLLWTWGCGNSGGYQAVSGQSTFGFTTGDAPQPVQNFGINSFYSPVA
jgi:hypothetical protein